MKKLIKRFFDNEVLSYLFFGAAATLVYMSTRLAIFALSGHTTFSTITANVTAVLFAFVTNDTVVFKQERKGWQKRLIKFALARSGTLLLDIVLAQVLVDIYPNIIGQFVGNNRSLINSIESLFSQVLIIVLNYIFSKLFIFENKK
ncbi:GtrA family protein [Streptococcus panodentis]|uniref:GtrA family protein n=1 Tax=Streptococcus panodentis TaxID=1581472 RepID=A0ABS5AZU9_9STRE|nr:MULTISPECIES: GtrA family protein [Streptococcus]KXT84009.1 GtrA family protein [Streptococcus sp. DD11]MBP2621791.1 GtrA family protein [Streptococcus panodentis]